MVIDRKYEGYLGRTFLCKDPDKIKNVFKQDILNHTLNKQVYYKPVDHL